MNVDASGALWLASIGESTNVIYKFKEGIWSVVDFSRITEKPKASTMMTDRSGNLWIGLGNRQLIKSSGNSSKLYTESDGLSVGVITALSEHDDHIWIGGTKGIAYFRNGRFTTC
jgi:ligand-binding sensor domain-containing protein